MPDVENKGNLGTIHNFQQEADKINAKKKKSSTGKNPTSLSAAQKQQFITDWLNGHIQYLDDERQIAIKKPDEKFVLLETISGIDQPYKITGNNELEGIIPKVIAKVISHHCQNQFRNVFDLTAKEIKECVEYWMLATPSVAEPPLFGWPDDNHLVRRRLPFQLQEGPTPLFDEMFSRVDNAQALKIFIGSLFFRESNDQQYVWMYGEGNDGKGTLAKFLRNCLGHMAISKTVPSEQNRFWTYSIKDRRLVIMPEVNDVNFVTSDFFKLLIGGDHVPMERKFGDAFDAEIFCKFLLLSNFKPNISSQTADQRRIIFCQWSQFKKTQDPEYYGQLEKEGPYFLTDCINLYKKHCPKHGLIPTDNNKVKEITDENESEYQTLLDRFCNVGPQYKCKPILFDAFINEHFKKRNERSNFRDYLKKVKGVYKKGIKNANDQTDYFWVGIDILEVGRNIHSTCYK